MEGAGIGNRKTRKENMMGMWKLYGRVTEEVRGDGGRWIWDGK